MSMLASIRWKLKHSIQSANQTSERAVVTAGRCLDTVVKTARQHIGKTTALLRAQTGEQSLSGSVRVLSGLLRAYFQGTAASMEAQRDRCREMTTYLEQIAASAALIDGLTIESRVLAINAQIETARLGQKLGGLSVIATELSRLSHSIGQANRMIGDLAGRLGQSVPVLDRKSTELLEQSRAFSASIDQQLGQIDSCAEKLGGLVGESVAASEQATTAIVKHSLEALSALQFQDTVAQQLTRLDGLFDGAEGGEEQAEAPSLEPGSLVLF